MRTKHSRREFLSGSAATLGAAATAAGFTALANPIAAAAQSVGVKPADLPNLTIKEVKVYVTDLTGIHKLNSPETGELLSVVTEGGIEGNYTIGDRNATPGWLEWAKSALVGKSVIDLLPVLTSTTGMKGPGGFDGGPARRGGAAGGGRGGGGFVAPGFGASGASPGSHSAFEGAAIQDQVFLRAAAAPGRTITPLPRTSACGTFWARQSTAPFTKSSPGAPPPRTNCWPMPARSISPRWRTMFPTR